MLNMIISGFGLVLFLSMFRQAYFVSGINRVYLGLYKGVIESSVVYFNDEGLNITPYFDRALFKDAVGSYFEREFKGYKVTYSLTYKFRNTTSRLPNAQLYPNTASVQITLYDNPLVTFDKKASFRIRKN